MDRETLNIAFLLFVMLLVALALIAGFMALRVLGEQGRGEHGPITAKQFFRRVFRLILWMAKPVILVYLLVAVFWFFFLRR